MFPVYTMQFACKVIEDCEHFNIYKDEVYRGAAKFSECGAVTYEIYTQGDPIRCDESWFQDFFKLIPMNGC